MSLKSIFIIVLILGILYVSITATIGSYLWPYAVNTWLVYVGKEPTFSRNLGALLGPIPGIGWLCIPGSLGTYITMLFLK